MEEIYPNLYVGSDDDFDKAEDKGFSIVSACKDGPHGHRSVLGYTTLGAHKNQNYFFVKKGNHLALNLIDADDPKFISDEAVTAALSFIKDKLDNGKKVLVHCNRGLSRSPSIILLYLRMIGDLPERFWDGFSIFHKLYPKYDPALGIKHYTQKKYSIIKVNTNG